MGAVPASRYAKIAQRSARHAGSVTINTAVPGHSAFLNASDRCHDTCRLIVTDLATAQLASIKKARPRPDDGQLASALFGTETPRDGLRPNDRIMFFAAAIGGRLYGKEQTQADA